MTKEVTKDLDINQSAIEKCLLDGDLSQLSDDQRSSYYKQVCDTVGLNPLTQPFQYIVLNGKLKMYALKGATDQLRRIYNISCEVKNTEKIEDLLVITVKATNNTNGRVDEDMGFAKISGLKGDMLGNAMLKATTKAKRRVTLSMCGLGMLDEEEVASIPDDTGSGKGKKEYKPDAGSQKLMNDLTEKEPVKENSDSTDDAYRKAESELDADFAKCNDQAIHDEIINLLNDIKYEESDEKIKLLREFAKNHPENEALFKKTALDKNKQWQKDLSVDGYEQLKEWMITLDNLFKEDK
tara:strand:+ start:27 stop:914 length:888 start_codon:yes stop_codon:yes gene_type:complete